MTWLSYASAVIALLALMVALRTYVRQGSRIRASYIVRGYRPYAPPGQETDPATVRVFVRNLGQAPTQISGIYFGVLARYFAILAKSDPPNGIYVALERPDPLLSLNTGEPKFPHILVGDTAVVWETPIPAEMIRSITRKCEDNEHYHGPFPYKLRYGSPYPLSFFEAQIYVFLATGRRIRVKWAKSDPPKPWMMD